MKTLTTLFALLVSLFTIQALNAHCQVPCGIYGDELKFGELEQHVATIAKASTKIQEIAGMESPSALDQQQIVRWVDNKESHAQRIIDEAANYFLAQRIKPGADHYADKVELLHHIIVYSMKAKQGVDGEAAKILGEKIAAFKEMYLHHHH
ncbi:superoxide dismutase, Ni [Puniceicoccaceae bacterium K14]|nr:superoxide dismutase, Ni [Puniceicoccaceae bacterium K14]